MTSLDTILIRAEGLRAIGQATIEAVGAPRLVASAVAEHLLEANLTGHDSHGIHLLPIYVDDARRGELRAAAEPRIEWERHACALVSGEWGFGPYAGRVAMDVAMRLAREHGVGLVGLVRINHLGRMGAYMEQAAEAGFSAMSFVSGLGGATQATPYGGSRGAYGANPFAAGFPAGTGNHLVVDYATTKIAGGKVMIARTTGTRLPPDVLLDSEGRPTQDPEALFNGGALLPFGAHKGYGLALFVELMGRVLTGSDALGDPAGGGDRYGRSGATFLAMDVGVFRPAGEASEAAQRTIARVRQVPPATGFREVITPGELETRTREERKAIGVELPRVTVEAISNTARGVGVAEEIITGFTGPTGPRQWSP